MLPSNYRVLVCGDKIFDINVVRQILLAKKYELSAVPTFDMLCQCIDIAIEKDLDVIKSYLVLVSKYTVLGTSDWSEKNWADYRELAAKTDLILADFLSRQDSGDICYYFICLAIILPFDCDISDFMEI